MKNGVQGIAVIGIGLIGGSIIRDLKQIPNNRYQIYGVHDDPSALYAKEKGLIAEVLTYDTLFSHDISLVIIASPISTISNVAKTLKSAYLKSNQRTTKILVIDVASVKNHIAKTFATLSDDTIQFVATHPMAGTEFSGLDHARLNLFRGKPWIVTPHKNNNDNAIALAKNFIHLLGGRFKELDPATHDTYAAAVSHSTILLSNYIFEFLSSNYPESLDLAGSGFDSTTRLASGNPELHASIMHDNAETIDSILDGFAVFLREKRSAATLPKEYFAANKFKRDEWLSKKTIVNDAKKQK